MLRPDGQEPQKSPAEAGLKRSEIAMIALAVGLPLALFVMLLIPGAMEAVIRALFAGWAMWVVFGGAALALIAVVGLRAWRRATGSKRRARDPDKAPTFWDFWRDPYR